MSKQIATNTASQLTNSPPLPTLKPSSELVPSGDAKTLQKAFEGKGCDQHVIFNILTHRTSPQRRQIKLDYEKLFGKQLVERVMSELKEPMEFLAVSLLYIGPYGDTYILRRATQGIGTDESLLIHILSTRSSEQISAIKDAYIQMFKKPLKDHITGDTSGSFKNILLHLIENPRSKVPGNFRLAAEQATLVYSRSSSSLSASNDLISLICDSSYEQIQMMASAFQQQYGKPLTTFLDKYSGDYEVTIRSICSFSIDPLKYFAEYLRTSLNNLCIRDVICLFVTRCEIDLGSILNTYSTLYCSRPEADLRSKFKEKYPTVVDALEMLMGLK